MAGPARPPLPSHATPLLAALLALMLAAGALGLIAGLQGSPEEGRRPLAVLALLSLSGGLLLLAAALRRRQAAPAELALRDPLTGLPTHAGLRDRLDGVLSLTTRQGWRVGVLVIDIRGFQTLNEAHGRDGGDLALRLVATRLRHAVRKEDLVARIGGDRFAVVQTALGDPAGALRLAERLSVAVAEPLPLQRSAPVVAADIGIAIGPEDGMAAEILLARAEDALSAARAAPQPTIHCFAPEQEAAMRSRRTLERELREALAEGAFHLHWQPQRRLADRGLIGFEALLRWPHPTRGMIPPDQFIPIAEANGLIVPLGAWVIRTAAAEAARWPAGLKAAVNLSAAQLRAEGLLETVAQALAASGLPPHRLELEVTESQLIQDGPGAARVLAALRELGVSVALDDFGTGWSSLAYLRRFAFDQIKMDRAFLRDVDADPRAEAILGAILGLGRGLGLTVVAEGIETEEQAARLLALGCERGQGWLLGRPMPAEAARALIAAELPAEAARSAA